VDVPAAGRGPGTLRAFNAWFCDDYRLLEQAIAIDHVPVAAIAGGRP
jgi:hypothetical protein